MRIVTLSEPFRVDFHVYRNVLVPGIESMPLML